MVSTLRRLWLRPGVRAATWQTLALSLIAAAAWWLIGNVAANLPRMNMRLGFGFLWDRAGFEIGDNLLGYRAGDPIFDAFLAGFANTIQVATLGIVLTTVFGTLVALARLSSNLMLSRAAWLYVEVMRNIPLLLQLLFWHLFLISLLPPPRAAWTPLPGVFLSNRGIAYPTLVWEPALGWAMAGAVAGAALAVVWARTARRRREQSGRYSPVILPVLAVVLLPPVVTLIASGAALELDVPALRGFNFVGGGSRAPEFAVLLAGLVAYQTAFAAETIRAGILGVPRGQLDAARSLGLTRARMMRLVVLPQALRIVVPPLTSQFMSLTKNSSLAVAIGYPELVRVSTVVTGDTGRSVECVTIILVVYLTLSLATAAFMNWYNARIALRGG